MQRWLPSPKRSRSHIATIVTCVIAVIGFSHSVVGSFDAFRPMNLDIGLGEMPTRFLFLVFLGNFISGTALLACAQITKGL